MSYPTQQEIDTAIARAHELRAEAIAQLFRKLFRLK